MSEGVCANLSQLRAISFCHKSAQFKRNSHERGRSGDVSHGKHGRPWITWGWHWTHNLKMIFMNFFTDSWRKNLWFFQESLMFLDFSDYWFHIQQQKKYFEHLTGPWIKRLEAWSPEEVFAWLLAPLTPNDFLQQHWERCLGSYCCRCCLCCWVFPTKLPLLAGEGTGAPYWRWGSFSWFALAARDWSALAGFQTGEFKKDFKIVDTTEGIQYTVQDKPCFDRKDLNRLQHKSS